MALTYTDRQNLYKDLTGDTSSKNVSLGDRLMNEIEKLICSLRDFSFLRDEFTISTIANQSIYDVNSSVKRLVNVYALSGNQKYDIVVVNSPDEWRRITASSASTAQIPTYCRLKGRQIEFYPMPNTTGIAIYVEFKKKPIPLSIPDYTTGSIVSVSNGGKTITGSGTSWHSRMKGLYISITKDGSTTSGDGRFYYITDVPNATTITIREPYEGESISAATQPYVIGELSMLPEDFHILPVYKAVSIYYASIYKDAGLSKLYNDLFVESLNTLISEHSVDDTNPSLGDDDIQVFDHIKIT